MLHEIKPKLTPFFFLFYLPCSLTIQLPYPAKLNVLPCYFVACPPRILYCFELTLYFYCPLVQRFCHSELQFNELGGLRVQGPSSAATFIEEVIQELWKPQMIGFVRYHCQRTLNKGSRSQGLSNGQGALQLLEDRQEQVRQWSQSKNPFSWEYVYRGLFSRRLPAHTLQRI